MPRLSSFCWPDQGCSPSDSGIASHDFDDTSRLPDMSALSILGAVYERLYGILFLIFLLFNLKSFPGIWHASNPLLHRHSPMLTIV
jgi:hypothetical protein